MMPKYANLTAPLIGTSEGITNHCLLLERTIQMIGVEILASEYMRVLNNV